MNRRRRRTPRALSPWTPPVAPAAPAANPICSHDHRIHYLGGGLWVCFECWARMIVGGRR